MLLNGLKLPSTVTRNPFKPISDRKNILPTKEVNTKTNKANNNQIKEILNLIKKREKIKSELVTLFH